MLEADVKLRRIKCELSLLNEPRVWEKNIFSYPSERKMVSGLRACRKWKCCSKQPFNYLNGNLGLILWAVIALKRIHPSVFLYIPMQLYLQQELLHQVFCNDAILQMDAILIVYEITEEQIYGNITTMYYYTKIMKS